MTYPELENAIEVLKGGGIDFCLVHEAALAAYGFDMHLQLQQIDILVPPDAVDAVARAAEGGQIRVIAHTATGGKAFDETAMRWSSRYGCNAADPYDILENLEEASNIDQLLESRAWLAAVLYCDVLDDAQLALFREYVHGM